MKKLMISLQGMTPRWLKRTLHCLGVHKLVGLLMDKKSTELGFQTAWAKTFKNNRHKVLEYWEQYRYLSDIKAIVQDHDDMNVLDVGCGISTVLHFIKGHRIGIDPLAESYKQIYDYPEGIHIQQADGEYLPFGDGFFDLVFCTNVIDHVTDPYETIGHIARVLKPHGYFVLTVELFEENIKRDAAHPHSLRKDDVMQLIQDRFTIVMEKESPWIGMQRYVDGGRKSTQQELILVLQKQ